MRIREAEAADAAAVADLWTEGYLAAGREARRPYGEREVEETAAAGTLIVAHEGDDVLGVAALRPPGSGAPAVAAADEAELCRLAVAERARGRGVGRALACRCLELADEAGAPAVALWSRPWQEGAHRLYESLGFRRAPERDTADDLAPRMVFTRRAAGSR